MDGTVGVAGAGDHSVFVIIILIIQPPFLVKPSLVPETSIALAFPLCVPQVMHYKSGRKYKLDRFYRKLPPRKTQGLS